MSNWVVSISFNHFIGLSTKNNNANYFAERNWLQIRLLKYIIILFRQKGAKTPEYTAKYI